MIVAVEVTALVAVVRYTFGADPQEDKLLAQGLPPTVIRLMLAEARFWKKVWHFLSGR